MDADELHEACEEIGQAIGNNMLANIGDLSVLPKLMKVMKEAEQDKDVDALQLVLLDHATVGFMCLQIFLGIELGKQQRQLPREAIKVIMIEAYALLCAQSPEPKITVVDRERTH